MRFKLFVVITIDCRLEIAELIQSAKKTGDYLNQCEIVERKS